MKNVLLLLTILCLTYSCKKESADPSSTPIYTETFDKDVGTGFWTGTKDGNTLTASLLKGYYVVSNTANHLRILTGNPAFMLATGNVALETKISITPLNGNTSSYAGVAWGVNNSTGQTYVFGYFPDGYFNIWAIPKTGTVKMLKKATQTPAIKPKGFNKLRIEKKEGTLHFMINGTEVYSMSSKPADLDLPGIMIDKQTKAKLDYFKVEEIP